MLSAAVKSQVARDGKEDSGLPNLLKQGEEVAVSSPQIAQVRGEGGKSPPYPPLKVEVGASMDFARILHAIESTKMKCICKYIHCILKLSP